MRWREAFALVAALATCMAAGAQGFPEPRIERLGNRVHVLLGPIQHANASNQGYMVNATVIEGERGVILVDSGGSLDVGRHIAAAVRRITAKPVTHVVNTHHHGDHYLGNGAFAGATVVSSETGRRLVQQTGGEWIAIMEHDVGHALPATRVIAADVVYPSGRTEALIDGIRLVFWVPRGSHTAGDLMVYVPGEGVLVTGDILVNGVVPTLQDGFLADWIATLGEILALGARHFVPGHGAPMSARDVESFRDRMVRFRDGVREGYRKGFTETEVRASLELAGWTNLERAYVIPRNVNRAYLEAERESFDK